MIELKTGDKAPDFSGKDQSGNTVRLSDYKGKKLVLYFYPKDNTSGCTAEACSLRDSYSALQAKGYSILGVSPDSEKSHTGFIAKYNLPFPLIADTGKTIAQAYGVWAEKKLYGKTYMGILRTTFKIDENGIIEDIITKVRTKDHGEQIMKLLLFLGILFFPYLAFAQANYIFPEFVQGEIYYKESAVAASVNYNLFLSDMLVMDGKKKKRLTNVDKIEYVSAGSRRFIPLNDNSFGEILISGGLTLAVRYSGHIDRVNEHTKNVSRLSLNKMLDSGNPVPEGITIKVDSVYYFIKEKDEQKKFYLPGANVAKASHSGINKLFAKYKSEINAFIENNNTDFSSFDSLKQLVEFCEKYTD